MSERWIVNTSPLISLTKAGYSGLLADAGAEIVVPDIVRSEILAGREDDPARLLLESGFGSMGVIEPDWRVAEWRLGAGETAVLSLALSQPGTRVVIDDRAARRCARVLGVPMIGTIGVVVRARRDGRVGSLREAFERLVQAGFWLSPALSQTLLREFGELE